MYDTLRGLLSAIANATKDLRGISHSLRINAQELPQAILESVPAINGMIGYETDSDASQEIIFAPEFPKETPAIILVFAVNPPHGNSLTLVTVDSSTTCKIFNSQNPLVTVNVEIEESQGNPQYNSYKVTVGNPNEYEVSFFVVGVE